MCTMRLLFFLRCDLLQLTIEGNLQEVLVELNRQNKAKQDFISPAQGMHLREDGHTFEINHLMEANIEEVLTAHELYYEKSEVWIETEKMYEVLYELTV